VKLNANCIQFALPPIFFITNGNCFYIFPWNLFQGEHEKLYSKLLCFSLLGYFWTESITHACTMIVLNVSEEMVNTHTMIVLIVPEEMVNKLTDNGYTSTMHRSMALEIYIYVAKWNYVLWCTGFFLNAHVYLERHIVLLMCVKLSICLSRQTGWVVVWLCGIYCIGVLQFSPSIYYYNCLLLVLLSMITHFNLPSQLSCHEWFSHSWIVNCDIAIQRHL